MLKFFALALALIAAPVAAGDISLINKVQNEIHARTKFLPEQDGKDNWRIPKRGIGDCEDFALLKRITLIQAGWDENDLKIVLVSRPLRGGVYEGHAVLWVKSLNIVMDSPLDAGRLDSIRPQEFEGWAKAGGWRFECVFADISEGQKDGPVTDRCEKKKR